jgi:excisionase family DNA binding protein
MSATDDSSATQDDDVLTVEQAAKFLRLGRNAVYDAIGRGAIPHRRIGRSIRLSRVALLRWLEGT